MGCIRGVVVEMNSLVKAGNASTRIPEKLLFRPNGPGLVSLSSLVSMPCSLFSIFVTHPGDKIDFLLGDRETSQLRIPQCRTPLGMGSKELST